MSEVSKPHLSLLDEARNELGSLALISYHGTPSGVWFADIDRSDIEAWQSLLSRLVEQLEALEADRDQWRQWCSENARRAEDAEERLEAQQRLLFAADAAWKWVSKEYPNVVERMPPKLYRELREARVPYPAKSPQ